MITFTTITLNGTVKTEQITLANPKQTKQELKAEKLLKMIIKMGGKKWIKDDLDRVYINNSILNILLVEQGLPVVSFDARNNKIFLDVKTNIVMRRFKKQKSIIALDLN